jgi:phage baseplate assembly protein W
MHIDFPFRIDDSGRTAETNDQDYVRDLIEQVLFTGRGERVNRPDFGCGIGQSVFEPNDIARSAVESVVASDLQRWLSEVLLVRSVRVEPTGARRDVLIEYQPLFPGNEIVQRFDGSGGP